MVTFVVPRASARKVRVNGSADVLHLALVGLKLGEFARNSGASSYSEDED
jgi:hypothetical protein